MNKRLWLLILPVGVVAVIIVGILAWNSATTNKAIVIGGTAVPPVPTLNPDRVAQGAVIYTQHCAVCHGANLEGAPNWKQRLADGSLPPPPHDSTGHTWHHPDSLLLQIIAGGGNPVDNSKMPAFGDKLTEADMVAVLEFIKSKWDQEAREYQWWMTVTRDKTP